MPEKCKYIVLPEQVCFDSRLPPMARLLYGLISSLSAAEGFCWASNRFLADQFGLKPETVSRAIKALADAGYIRLEFGGQGNEARRIFTLDNFVKPHDFSVNPHDFSVNDPCQKNQGTLDQKVKEYNLNYRYKELFARFWSAYPRKTAKQAALKAFQKLAPDEALLADMLSALDWQRTSDDWQREGGKFVPYPATWLNGRRWEDQRPQPDAPTEPARPVPNYETYVDENGKRRARLVPAPGV